MVKSALMFIYAISDFRLKKDLIFTYVFPNRVSLVTEAQRAMLEETVHA